MSIPTTPKNYVSNRSLLREIARSKDSYCWYESDDVKRYDGVVKSLDQITPEFLAEALERKREAIAKKGVEHWDGGYPDGPLDTGHLVIRWNTYDHVPDDADGKTRKQGDSNTTKIRTNFPPFKHFVLREGSLVEVARSHWQGSIENGHFSMDHGRTTEQLGSFYILMSERYMRRAGLRGYSYVSEMTGNCVLAMAASGLKFDCTIGFNTGTSNPFAFLTTCIRNAAIRVLNSERRVQNIRDDLLIMEGALPSFSRQLDDEFAQQQYQADTQADAAPKKRGRKPKAS